MVSRSHYRSDYRFFWIVPCVLFFLLFAPNLLREGMFVDGVWYAAISNNLAHNIGSFWAPSFTRTIYPSFYEHPPLALWIQSMFFRLFGEHFFLERLYCFIVLLITAWLIILIWNEIFSEKPEYASLGFLPLSLWMLNTGIFFAYPNNVLECTMTLFLLASICLLIRSTQTSHQTRYLYLVSAGVFIVLGFLTKGFVALFPLIFYMIYQIVFRSALTQNLVNSLLLILAFSGIIMLILQNPEARIFFDNYIETQVIESLKGQRVENLSDNRFFLLIGLLNSFTIVGAVCIVVIAFYYWLKKNSRITVSMSLEDKKWGGLFLLMGFSASLPLLISLKQAGYYLVPSIAMFSISISIYMTPITAKLLAFLGQSKSKKSLYSSVIILLIVSVVLALSNLGTVDKRDRDRIAIVKKVSKVVPRGAVLSSNIKSFDHSLHGFFQRYHMVALDTVQENLEKHIFLLSDTELEKLGNKYQLIKSMNDMYLYKKHN